MASGRRFRFLLFLIGVTLGCWLFAFESSWSILASPVILGSTFLLWRKESFTERVSGWDVAAIAIIVVLLVTSVATGWINQSNEWFRGLEYRPQLAICLWGFLLFFGYHAYRDRVAR